MSRSTINDIIGPILIKHGFVPLHSITGRSRRPCKRGARLNGWTNRKIGLQAFVYDDISIGLRDSNLGMKVELDIDFADPTSLDRLETWIKEKVARWTL